MENQNLEWKESWRDDYLKTLCGFANANGGVMEIGRCDDGEIIGVYDTKKLMDDLPNKIRSAMGIVPSIELLEHDGKHYISITINPYSFPISCKGKYYLRSGSTTQELSGVELDSFMLRNQGKTWDGVPVPYVKFNDFESDAFKAFRRKAIGSGRLTAQDLEITDEMLLRNLQLVDGDYLKRAALLVFHHDPENWVPGAYIKIGMFENTADILYQDEIHGPLITMADKAEDLVYTKYFKGIISYEGLQRIETFPVPRLAFREAVLNAIQHRDYSTGNPIHIHIYPDKVLIYNDGRLPENWTVAKLLSTHTSMPYNPLIAGAFFRSGQIEAWGRGIEKIAMARNEWGQPEPFYEVCSNYVMIGFDTDVGIGDKIGDKIGGKIGDKIGDKIGGKIGDKIGGKIGDKIGGKNGGKIGDKIGRKIGENIGENIDKIIDEIIGNNKIQRKIINLMILNPTISAKLIADAIGISPRTVESNINSLKKAGLVERIGSTKSGHWGVKLPKRCL